MKKFLILLCFSTFAGAVPVMPPVVGQILPVTWRFNVPSGPLAGGFPAQPQLKTPSHAFAQVQVYNGSAGELEMNCSAGSVPSPGAAGSIPIPPSIGYQTPDPKLINVPLGNACWFSGYGGQVTGNGVIEAIGWPY